MEDYNSDEDMVSVPYISVTVDAGTASIAARQANALQQRLDPNKLIQSIPKTRTGLV